MEPIFYTSLQWRSFIWLRFFSEFFALNCATSHVQGRLETSDLLKMVVLVSEMVVNRCFMFKLANWDLYKVTEIEMFAAIVLVSNLFQLRVQNKDKAKRSGYIFIKKLLERSYNFEIFEIFWNFWNFFKFLKFFEIFSWKFDQKGAQNNLKNM